MYSHTHILERAKLFKKFSLAVDEIDTYRKQIAPQSRRDSKKLHELYIAADAFVRRLKRYGDV